MKGLQGVLVVMSLALLSGCSVTAARGQCEFMLPTERERCLQANKSNEEALKSRRESKRDAKQPFVLPSKKDGGEPAGDDQKK